MLAQHRTNKVATLCAKTTCRSPATQVLSHAAVRMLIARAESLPKHWADADAESSAAATETNCL